MFNTEVIVLCVDASVIRPSPNMSNCLNKILRLLVESESLPVGILESRSAQSTRSNDLAFSAAAALDARSGFGGLSEGGAGLVFVGFTGNLFVGCANSKLPFSLKAGVADRPLLMVRGASLLSGEETLSFGRPEAPTERLAEVPTTGFGEGAVGL